MDDATWQDARELYHLLARGGVALAPTETGYGLLAMTSQAVARIYELKGRPSDKPCVTVGSMSVLGDVAAGIAPPTMAWLARAVTRWPMAVIARLRVESELLANTDPYVVLQCTRADTIAVFFGVGELIAAAAELARADGRLIVGSSANLSGTGNNYRLADVPPSIRGAVDRVFEHGPSRFPSTIRLASTILDLRTGEFQRRGVCFDEIEVAWRRHGRSGTGSLPMISGDRGSGAPRA